MDICEVKRSQRHLLATIENKRLGVPILCKVSSSAQSYFEIFTQPRISTRWLLSGLTYLLHPNILRFMA